jgi:hypothetical protein
LPYRHVAGVRSETGAAAVGASAMRAIAAALTTSRRATLAIGLE